MKKFLIHLLKFALVSILLVSTLLIVANQLVVRHPFKNGETESNLLVLNESQYYDYLILGISHARNFSRNTHHEMFVSALHGKAINLAQGDGLGGLENQYWYFTYFLKKHNSAKHMILVLSPTLMYSNLIDQNSVAFYREPIKLEFIKHLWRVGGPNKKDQLFHYVKSKLGHNWWLTKPTMCLPNIDEVPMLDTAEVREGMVIAYPQGLDPKVFEERAKVLDGILQLAKQNNIEPIIVIPPALFGKWPGHDNVLSYVSKKYPKITIIDSSTDVLNPKMYSDHHHLNTAGMRKWLTDLQVEISNTQ